MSWFGKLFGGKKTPKVLEWRAFAEYCCARIAALDGVTAQIDWGATVDETSIAVSLANGGEARVNLSNYYRQYSAQPEQLDELVHAAVAAVQAVERDTADSEIDRTRILPVVKHRTWLTQTRPGDDSLPAGPLVRPDVGDLVLAYVEDGKENMRFLVPSDLARLGLADIEALHTLAVENFAAYARTCAALEVHAPGVYAARTDGFYDASLFLFAEELARGAEIAGELVVAIPARDMLLFCSADDAAALRTLREQVARAEAESAYLISPQLYVWRDERWQVFEAD